MAASTSDEPDWLSAWRRGDAPAAAARPGHQHPSQGESTGSGTTTDKRGTGQRFTTGFSEPVPWEWDGGKRREAVYDVDHNPPRFIRHVGWRICVTCARPYWSDDVVRVRMCNGCKSVSELRKSLRL